MQDFKPAHPTDARTLSLFTRDHIGGHDAAYILDNRIISAPVIDAPILGNQARDSRGFAMSEIRRRTLARSADNAAALSRNLDRREPAGIISSCLTAPSFSTSTTPSTTTPAPGASRRRRPPHLPPRSGPAWTPTPLTDYFLDHSDAYWRAMDPTTETRPILAIRTAHWLATLEAFGHADAALAEDTRPRLRTPPRHRHRPLPRCPAAAGRPARGGQDAGAHHQRPPVHAHRADRPARPGRTLRPHAHLRRRGHGKARPAHLPPCPGPRRLRPARGRDGRRQPRQRHRGRPGRRHHRLLVQPPRPPPAARMSPPRPAAKSARLPSCILCC